MSARNLRIGLVVFKANVTIMGNLCSAIFFFFFNAFLSVFTICLIRPPTCIPIFSHQPGKEKNKKKKKQRSKGCDTFLTEHSLFT